MNRAEILKAIQKHYNYQKYLEIGVKAKFTFDQMECEFKVGLDKRRACNPTRIMSSDEYFDSEEYKDEQFDLVFVDGDHSKEQVEKDIDNSLKRLLPNGTVVLHDMNPLNEDHLNPNLCGDGWEAFAKLRTTRKDLNMFCIPDDLGVGIIQKGSQELYEDEIKSGWDFFYKHKNELMKFVEFNKMTENLV